MTAFSTYERWAPLYRNLVRREVRQKYKGSMFGLAWTLVTPLIVVATYSAVFHYIWRVVDIPHYALFLFTGLTIWTFFLGGAQVASSSLVGNGNLVKKVRFPREILPAAAMTANAVTAGAMFIVAIPLCMIIADGWGPELLLLPPFIVFLTLFTFGFGIVLAALNVYFRDVEHILGAIAMPWFFLTPIFYTFDSLPGVRVEGLVLDILYYGNPITPFVSAIREIVFYGGAPGLGDWVYCATLGVVATVGGMRLFRHLEREMAVEL